MSTNPEMNEQTIAYPFKLWRISQTVNNNYDTYDSAVVVADTEDEARMIHPGGWHGEGAWDGTERKYGSWCNAADVQVEYVGVTDRVFPEAVVCASFNAG